MEMEDEIPGAIPNNGISPYTAHFFSMSLGNSACGSALVHLAVSQSGLSCPAHHTVAISNVAELSAAKGVQE